jgi:multidrug efflux pump subunit AcrA (membrane-fusion protein)
LIFKLSGNNLLVTYREKFLIIGRVANFGKGDGMMGFLKKNWKIVLTAVIGIFIGASFGPSQEELNAAVSQNDQLSSEHNKAEKQLAEMKEKNKELQAKVDEAAPYFELSEKERENKKKEAELKAAELEKQKKAEEEAAAKEAAEKAAAEEKAEKERAAAELAARTKTLSAGTYVAGRDIEPGLYDTSAVSGQGNFIVQNTFDLKVNEMFGTGGEFYNNSFNNLELEDGDTIEINNNLKIKFSPK